MYSEEYTYQDVEVEDVIWRPQPVGQVAFLACPFREALFHSNRGAGKSDALLMNYLQGVGRGWGADWRGILFRQSFPQLADIIVKSNKWFKQIFPEAQYNKSEHVWHFPQGEQLLLRYVNDPEDYWNYHGHEFPWMGFEELTTWPTMDCYHRLKSLCRSSR